MYLYRGLTSNCGGGYCGDTDLEISYRKLPPVPTQTHHSAATASRTSTMAFTGEQDFASGIRTGQAA